MITSERIQILNGKVVELVCFAQFGVYVHLEDEILLTVEAEFEHHQSDAQCLQLTTFPVRESSLMKLLDCSVVSATIEPDGRLRLAFSNGDVLTVWKRPEFESYRLRVGDRELFA